MERVIAAGYRNDWRGLVAYACTPERWRTGPYVGHLVLAALLVVAMVVPGVVGTLPVLNVAVRSAFAAWFVVRPVLGVIERRAQLRGQATVGTADGGPSASVG